MIERLPDPTRSRAVLIGTSSYSHQEFPDLPGVANNLSDLADLLTSPRGARLEREHCVVALDPPDQKHVGDQIVEAARDAEDVLLVYYAGHGEMTWDKNNELYLTMRDSNPDSLRTSALRCEDLRQYIHRSRASIRVLILDCCFAGTQLPDTMSGSDQMLDHVAVNGAYVLASAFGKALAPIQQRHTLFTGELLRVLRDGIPAESRMLLTLDALYREVRSSLHKQGYPEPGCNHSDTAASLALAANPAHKVQRQLADFLSRAKDLGAAEADAKRAYDLTIDRILKPNLPPFTAGATSLRQRVEELSRRVAAGSRPSVRELDAVDAELIAARDAVRQLRVDAERPLDARNDLRRLLDSYRGTAVRLKFAEEAEFRALYDTAWNLLWVKPCDLGRADAAVDAYINAVATRRERER